MSGNDRKHIADELDFQIKRIWEQIGNLPPTGGEGWGTLKFEELADVAKRASDALRESAKIDRTDDPRHWHTTAETLGWHTGTTGE